ncbi:PRC-barrel domain-containing protein [Oricola nitratireducens]|uniref:PRC-barrel domain-containing protein n=1 Tax=Oricola nitratireducens TaxID=2775868 RepID=UPI0018681925|nr:PRC-barrel domain-containing protein [Oricola nitratireducens]
MKKRLLATTAAVALFATPMAYAQDASNADAMQNSSVFSSETYKDIAPVDGFYAADPHQVLATRFIGANIHSGAGEDAETIGDVNDIIMTPDGRAVAVIAGVGGFLGIGEKEVAVSMDMLAWTTDNNGDMVLVADLTRQQLEGAPAFDRSALHDDQTTAMDNSQVGTSQDGAMTANDDMANAEQHMNAEPATDDTMTTASTPRMETIPASQADLKADKIIGMSVTGADNETVGEVSDILIDKGGKVEAFVIDVGGFLGMNEKPVAVSFDKLQFARAEGSKDWTTIKTGLTRDALENQKAYTEDQYKSDKGSVILIAPVE